jgi:hypothetical protein
MSNGYDQFVCPKDGCEWSCAWPCEGACEHGGALSTVPLNVIVVIGEHKRWHDGGGGAMRWDDAKQNFVEVSDAS